MEASLLTDGTQSMETHTDRQTDSQQRSQPSWFDGCGFRGGQVNAETASRVTMPETILAKWSE